MAEQFADQQFVEYVIKSIVDHPDAVKAERTIDEMGVLITLSVSPEDMGQVIGRQGQTAKSVRTLLRVIGAKNDARVNLKILEPEGGKRFKEFQEQDARAAEQAQGGQPAGPVGGVQPMQPQGGTSGAGTDTGLEPPTPSASPMDDLKI